MSSEVLVKYNSRAGGIALCFFGLVTCVCMIAFGWYTLDSTYDRHHPAEFVAMGGAGIIFLVWKLFSLSAGKPYLETSSEGIFAGGNLHCYIPWDNVKNIETRVDVVKYKWSESTVKILSIELKDQDNVYFDKLSHRLLRKYFFREFPIDLAPENVTSWSSTRLRDALLARWDREKTGEAETQDVPS